MVVFATEIKSFHVEIDSHNTATITVILDNLEQSETVYTQAPGDHHIYQVLDHHGTIIRLIHQ